MTPVIISVGRCWILTKYFPLLSNKTQTHVKKDTVALVSANTRTVLRSVHTPLWASIVLSKGKCNVLTPFYM